MTRTKTYVFWAPFGPRDFVVFADAAQGYRFQQGLTAQGRASHIVETTGNSPDETQAMVRDFRARYVAQLAAQVAS